MRPVAILVGVLVALAVAFWLQGQLSIGVQAVHAAELATGGLLMVQFLVIAAAAPWLGVANDRRGDLPALAMLVMIPWPLFTILLQMSEVGVLNLAASQLLIAAVAVLGYFAARRLWAMLRSSAARRQTLAGLQLLPAAAFWVTRESWISWSMGTG